MIDDTFVTTIIVDPELSESLETVVSQNEVIVSQLQQLEEISEDCRQLDYYQLFTGVLIVAVLGILVGQGFVKIFKR